MIKDNLPAKPSSASEIDAFLSRAAALPALSNARGRLIFAIDATLSRKPTWTAATGIQSGMFDVAQGIGGLAVQLVYFRGADEFSASDWSASAWVLAKRMREVTCKVGFTQTCRVLAHAGAEAAQTKVGALVYIGDAFEENPNDAAAAAARMALLGVPAFMFHEGNDPHAAAVFRDIARITKGVYARFDAESAAQLRELLVAAAIYAAGGAAELRRHALLKGGEILRIANTMDGK